MEHAARTCCDTNDANALKEMFQTLQKTTAVQMNCLKEMKNAICSHCDPDTATGVYDGFCVSYCDKLYAACKDELYDTYADKSKKVPICN